MRERSAAGGIFRVIGRILLILLVTILLFAVFLLGVMGGGSVFRLARYQKVLGSLLCCKT